MPSFLPVDTLNNKFNTSLSTSSASDSPLPSVASNSPVTAPGLRRASLPYPYDEPPSDSTVKNGHANSHLTGNALATGPEALNSNGEDAPSISFTTHGASVGIFNNSESGSAFSEPSSTATVVPRRDSVSSTSTPPTRSEGPYSILDVGDLPFVPIPPAGYSLTGVIECSEKWYLLCDNGRGQYTMRTIRKDST